MLLTGWSTPVRPKIEIKDKKILVFTFSNIILPDSHANEPASHGYLKFKCVLYKNLPIGTRIDNRAYIYFDYNQPVGTNKTSNVRTHDVGIGSVAKTILKDGVSIYPNPADDGIIVFSNVMEVNIISIIDMAGKVVAVFRTNGIGEIPLNTLPYPEGIYFVKLQNEKETVVKKFIIRH
jgi:hypothetical protein